MSQIDQSVYRVTFSRRMRPVSVYGLTAVVPGRS